MPKFIKLLAITFFLFLSTVNRSNATDYRYFKSNVPFKEVHLVGSFTTSEGCNVRYDVYIDIVTVWGWPPIKVKSVRGTIVLSGTCHGTQHINIEMRATVTCYTEGENEITWDELSDPDAEEDLNDPAFKDHFISEVCNAETEE